MVNWGFLHIPAKRFNPNSRRQCHVVVYDPRIVVAVGRGGAVATGGKRTAGVKSPAQLAPVLVFIAEAESNTPAAAGRGFDQRNGVVANVKLR